MAKEYRIIISEEEMLQMPYKIKLRAVAFFNDYDEHKDDEVFKALYKRRKKINKEIEDYKFNKRHEGI